MRYAKIGGESGLTVSVVAMGTMSVAAGAMHAAVDESLALTTLCAAVDAGINFFDTAPGYGKGESEARLGKALASNPGMREKIVLATKASGPSLVRADVIAECEASLERLRTDVIDLFQIHWPSRATPLDETLDAMLSLQKSGKVRYLGMCNFGPLDLAEALARVAVLTDQVNYSLLARGAEFALLPLCIERDVGLLCYSPLAQGLLTGRYTDFEQLPADRCRSRQFDGKRPGSRHGEAGCEAETLQAMNAIRQIAAEQNIAMADLAVAWLLRQRGVRAVLCGASTPAQVHANARAADVVLSDAVVEQLAAATAPVKQKMGDNLDPWQGAGNSRIR
ncbi:MAG TPA: aldo/keto reductase [Tepidisphaeraceae bacterium]|nr:aldo/keto reductase [Tepidisphaeraceae bacterium]